MTDLRRNFSSREELADYLKREFLHLDEDDTHLSTLEGGRSPAEERLRQAQLQRYARTRNFLDGDVTRLSPYLRHGVLSLSEVRDDAIKRGAADKFINELAWRDYFQRVYAQLGHDIWRDLEPYKTGFQANEYRRLLPDDIRHGETGTVMDLFIQELIQEGYLHNRVRMYLAAYVVHWRRVRWQAGARWFLEHLVDGDPASNNLSWQWVASTFSHKPYIFNADNMRKYCRGRYPNIDQHNLEPFEGSYGQISERLFQRGGGR